MKLNIPAAKDLKPVTPDLKIEKLVEKFLNGKVRTAILLAQKQNYKSTMVEVPMGAYEYGTKFYEVCAKALAPLGYVTAQSHDGGGMYSTLSVCWK